MHNFLVYDLHVPIEYNQGSQVKVQHTRIREHFTRCNNQKEWIQKKNVIKWNIIAEWSNSGEIEIAVRNLPLIKFKIAAELVFSVGCNNGPITIAGFMVTMSIPFSFTNFQAASSANVFESTYHCCETREKWNLAWISSPLRYYLRLTLALNVLVCAFNPSSTFLGSSEPLEVFYLCK